MKFKVVGKSLILTDYSHKITEGENSFDIVEIAVSHYHDDCDLSMLSFRFSEISEDGKTSAVQVLHHEKCDEKYIYLKGAITSDFSEITGKVIFMLTGVSGENVVAKFQSDPFTISDDISLASLPNTTTAEQLFNRAQLEVQKAIAAAERAEKASQTPTPAEIYPASETNLGGVKVDGKTITASEDGTISAPDSENLKAEITDIKSSQTSISNLAVQIAHPNNFLIYDDVGKPSVMVAIPKFYMDEVIDGASHTVHPAFIINGVEQDIIYISKYQNVVIDGRAYSLPMKKPTVKVNFDQAWNYCKAKGEGWHLITNAEWAAITLWCKKNGTQPKGNRIFGRDSTETNLPRKAITASVDSDGKTNQTLTGSGRESWYHDNTFAGIADLNGNVWEWCSGLRLVDGEIQILANNDAADWNNSVSPTSTLWKAIMPDGSLVAPCTNGTLKWDYTVNLPSAGTDKFQLTTSLENQQTNLAAYGLKIFSALTAKDGVNVPEILKSLCLFPETANNYAGETFWFQNIGERLSFRGGSWSSGAMAGIFELYMADTRASSISSIGFRSAYYGNI